MNRGEVLWTPPDDAWDTAAMGRFARQQGIDDFAELIRWSIADVDRFWAAATEFTGVRWVAPRRRSATATRCPASAGSRARR